MPKKLHFFLLYSLYYIKKYFPVVILGIIFGSFTYFQRQTIQNIYLSLQYRSPTIGMEGQYNTSNLPIAISNQISYGLTSLTANHRTMLSPIVEKYETDQNHLVHTFTLKTVNWQNGKKLVPEDININLPGVTVDYGQNYVSLKLTTPFSPLQTFLTQPLFLKKTLVGLSDSRVNNITFKDGYIKKMSLVNLSTKSQISYNFYPTSEELMTAFKLGEIDEIKISHLYDKFANWPNIKINQEVSTDKYLAIFLNTDKYNKQARQAIAYATPKTEEKNKRCYGPISSDSWAYNPQIKQYNFNATRASELFEKDSFDHLNLLVFDRNLLAQAEEIKKNWENIFKIKVNVNVANSSEQLADYDAVLTYNASPLDPDQYQFWHSTQITTSNITHLNNSRIDKLLEEGRLVYDQQERRQIYFDFQRYLLEESPAVFLEYPTIYTISRIK